MRIRFRRSGLRLVLLGLLVGGAMLALAGSAAAAPSCSTTVGVTTCTFSYSGAQESWVAPTGVTSITVDAYGASGMQLTAPSGRTNGLGAHVQATLAVTPGSTYYVTVGGAGSYGVGGGGFNGGGDGGTFDFSGLGLGSLGGGGGGATDFRTSSALSDRVVVAGGGGGDSWPTLGGNSGSDGNNGVCSLASNDGGTCVANAVGGKAGTSSGAVGGTGESVDGITGADAADVAAGSATGGAGASWPAPFDANTFLFQYGGGGGGGGYYGGSGGGAGMLVDISGLNGSDGGGGGGGGSDYVDPSATNMTVTDGGNVSSGSSLQTDGFLTITYNEPPPACTATGFYRDGINLTAKQIGGNVSGTLDATGCNIGVYYGPGTSGAVSGTITGSNYYGVVADRAAVNVTGAAIHDIGETQPNGSQHGVGILYTTIELTSDPSNMHFTVAGHATGTLSGTSITNYQKNGVVISGAGANVTAQSNTVTGYGMISYIAQNGIEVASGASALVKGNTVSGNWYTPTPVVACGLLFFQAGGVKQSGNNLFNNEVNLCNAGRGGGNFKP
jgi:hypothetical protein